jgi:catechol 2,3-dioxygenase-like lactoylglutathione lyase family enzyme
MIHHITIRVTNLERSKAFYAAALAPLGYRIQMEFSGFVGMGERRSDLWLGTYPEAPQMHVAFAADSTSKVDAFYRAAMAAGGRDNGPPGPRPDYGPEYYGAFVLDPDGHNIEATLLKPEKARATSGAKKKAASVAKRRTPSKKAAKGRKRR